MGRYARTSGRLKLVANLILVAVLLIMIGAIRFLLDKVSLIELELSTLKKLLE